MAPLAKTLLDFTPDFFLAFDEPQDLNRWFESWSAKNERDFDDQRSMGVPANPPLTLFLEGVELAGALRQRKTLFLDQLGTSPLAVGLLAPQNLEGSTSQNIEVGILRRASKTTQPARVPTLRTSRFLLSAQLGQSVSITEI